MLCFFFLFRCASLWTMGFRHFAIVLGTALISLLPFSSNQGKRSAIIGNTIKCRLKQKWHARFRFFDPLPVSCTTPRETIFVNQYNSNLIIMWLFFETCFFRGDSAVAGVCATKRVRAPGTVVPSKITSRYQQTTNTRALLHCTNLILVLWKRGCDTCLFLYNTNFFTVKV